MRLLEMNNQFARTTPPGWERGCPVEVHKRGGFYMVNRPWAPPRPSAEGQQVVEDVILYFSTQWDFFSWLSWWYS